jgi:glycosyltransferase involved in cell wall biosynthesis
MKVFILAAGDRSRASSRLRVWDHVEWLRQQGHSVVIDYVMPPGIHRVTAAAAMRIALRWPSWLCFALLSDRVLIQESLLLSPLIRIISTLRGSKIVFDFSDPVDTIGFGLRNRLQRLGFYMATRYSDHVIAENGSYVVDLARRGISCSQFFGPVDVARYQRHAQRKSSSEPIANKPLRIGWTGSPGTLVFIEPLFPILDQLAQQYPIELMLVGVTDTAYKFKNIATKFEAWTEPTEFELVPTFDLGLFVLDGSDLSKRRGAGKLFVYMAASVPFIASDIGIAADVMRQTGVGFPVANSSDWSSVLEEAIIEHGTRDRHAAKGAESAKMQLSYDAYRRHLREVWLA